MAAPPAAPALEPGTVLCTRSGGFAATMIRFGAALRGKPNLSNHIAVVHHTDKAGTVWTIEGRPGSCGWRDAKGYLASTWTMTNAAQPITAEQRAAIAKTMEALIGSDYAWDAIGAAAFADLGIRLPGWDEKWKDGEVKVQGVCSSLAAYAYAKCGVPCPPGERGVQPADWVSFILTRAWQT
jgi:hypothetical protein